MTLVGTGRAGVTVTATTGSPFSVAQGSVSVPGGGTAALEVVFTAGNEPAEGTLVLTAGSHTETVAAQGRGRQAPGVPAHRSSATSPTSSWSRACAWRRQRRTGRCASPPAGARRRGRCQQGVCVGSPRLCDDDNPCTVDACSPTEGCVTAPVVCPQPSNPCKVGVCQRAERLRRGNAADFSLCGSVDCKTANLCVAGTCRALPTPEGFVCAPPTPCQGEGQCHSGECERPDAGDLLPGLLAEARRRAGGGAGRARAAGRRGRASTPRCVRGCGLPAGGLHGEWAAALRGAV